MKIDRGAVILSIIGAFLVFMVWSVAVQSDDALKKSRLETPVGEARKGLGQTE